MTNEKKSLDEKALQNVYQSAKMGTEAISKLMPKVQNREFKSAMSSQLSGYQDFIKRSSDMLTAMNKAPEDASLMQKIPSELGMAFGVAMDKSDSKIAEMMINGSAMGLSEIKKTTSCSCMNKDTEKLVNDVIAFEESNIDGLKKFL